MWTGQVLCRTLNFLHWFQVKDRICFKMRLYVYKCIINVAPSYLCDLIPSFSDTLTVENRPRLGYSSDITKLLVPRSRKRAADHSFIVAAPRLWNELPIQLRETVSVSIFKRLLKTHLYQRLAVYCLYFVMVCFAYYFVRHCVLCRAPYKIIIIIIIITE